MGAFPQSEIRRLSARAPESNSEWDGDRPPTKNRLENRQATKVSGRLHCTVDRAQRKHIVRRRLAVLRIAHLRAFGIDSGLRMLGRRCDRNWRGAFQFGPDVPPVTRAQFSPGDRTACGALNGHAVPHGHWAALFRINRRPCAGERLRNAEQPGQIGLRPPVFGEVCCELHPQMIAQR